ncbi:unnamed protein product [Rotaria magnacalcarata]|uniref:Hexosyltransferase n=2 Tax=Rotaria magnacalcarata TaxID=392030 RepID=A0A815BAS1_9BILA|nr:unnamed protein product [Rotaria magnacalcarata]CAF1266805.1 unnamed protein product [Rotaria magnacalcarata]CAF2120096.1 unnamed protein product [Rotaria magnacalcarata]CAF3982757.1 unnamed protein product [Rotaria magnacalcarata]CAF4020963.1 unnamed protein product [Rotaria magnacalcarata]
MQYLSIILKQPMARLTIERWFFRSYRFHCTTIIKCILCLIILYLLNVTFGVQYYIWTERSFENEYHLRMTHIDITKLDEENPEKVLGVPKYIVSNTFIINNEYLCNNGDSETVNNPHLLILVKSAVENWTARQAIRMTWAKKEFLEKNNIKLAFVLGANEQNFSVEKESQYYKDIIQIDKVDFYYHNSYKMVMMLRWISQYCSSKSRHLPYNDRQKYVLFVDDDYFIDLTSLLIYINKIDEDLHMTSYERQTFLTGYVYQGSRPRRFLNDRWYISINDYPYDHYPPYVTAGCFLMTRSSARLFNIASKYTPLFRFDDIYMGLLAYSMSIKLIPNNDLFSSYGSSSILLTNQTGILSRLKSFFINSINLNSTSKPICIHGYRGKELIQIWNDIYQTNLTLSIIN